MSGLILPIASLTSLLGYFFSNTNKTNRKKVEVTSIINEREKPNGDNIYYTNKSNEVIAEELDRSKQNYKLAENPAETGMLPPLFNTFNQVGSESPTGFSKFNSAQLSELDNLYKTKNVLEVPERAMENRPMFKKSTVDGVNIAEQTNFIEFGKSNEPEISLLTGLPVERDHANMVPFFGSNIKQNTETFKNESLLDLHTGRTSTFKHKREVEKMFKEQPQNIHGMPVFTTQIETDRFVPSTYRQNDKPFIEERISAPIAGTIDNSIRPGYKSVNELRPGNKPKESYDGRFIAGQQGEVRGVQGKFEKNRPDKFFEQSQDQLLVTTGEFTAPKSKENYENLKLTSRQDYNMEYFGTVSTRDKLKSKQRIALDNSQELDGIFSSVLEQPKRYNFKNDYTRNVSGNKAVNDYGLSSITQYETERASTGVKTHLSNAHKPTNGIRTRFQDLAKETLKETTLDTDNSRNLTTEFKKGGINAYDTGVTDYDVKTTTKETTVLNNYKGHVNKKQDNVGGYIVNKYEARTTGKETLRKNDGYVSVPKSLTDNQMKRDLYDNAEFRDSKEILNSNSRPAGPNTFQISSGRDSHGEIKFRDNMKLKEDEDDRDKINFIRNQIIPNKLDLGEVSKLKQDDDIEDKAFINRLQTDIIQSQFDQNPYSIYNKNKQFQ